MPGYISYGIGNGISVVETHEKMVFYYQGKTIMDVYFDSDKIRVYPLIESSTNLDDFKKLMDVYDTVIKRIEFRNESFDYEEIVKILKEYNIVDGVIKNPGKFENEPYYVPYYYDLLLENYPDPDNNMVFNLGEDDPELFPCLKDVKQIIISESDNGFVTCKTISKKKLKIS